MTASAAPRTTAPPLPFWLRRRPAAKPARAALTTRDPRWWVGVLWLTASVALLGFVAHATLFGVLQHSQGQAAGYAELRVSLAKAETPLGQLGIDEKLVPAGTALALITIPSIGLSEVVRQGTEAEQLRGGVGHRRDSVMPGQAGTSVLFGRQSAYGGPFGQLAALVPGDKITVVTGQDSYTFTVFGLRRPGDPLPEALAARESRLQLVTADGIALAPSSVLYVDASLEGDAAVTPAQVFTTAALEPGEGAMEADPDGLLPFLFTFQWLAVAVALTFWLTRSWGRWQTWVVAAPVLLVLSAFTADRAMSLLPNLI